MTARTLPPRDVMIQAFLARDASYDGVFFTGVRTTGIFCRPTCAARKPRPENVVFFAAARDALLAGFRPCRRCRPLFPRGAPPVWLQPLLERLESDPSRRWTDSDLRALGLSPGRVRRWFQANHGMTFHAFSRARRLGTALRHIQEGEGVTRAAFSNGYGSLSAFNSAFKKLLGEPPARARTATVLTVTRIPTPLGPMLAGATEDALWILEFVDRRMLESQLARLRRRHACAFVPGTNSALRATARELTAYFEGRLRRFSVRLETPGTAFQTAVWGVLKEVPYGTTISYAELAGGAGRPSAVRAAARANGDNRISILVPCHRVVGSDGGLTGYGGGLWRKRKLLELEGAQAETRAARQGEAGGGSAARYPE